MNKVIDKGFRSCRFVSTIVKRPVYAVTEFQDLVSVSVSKALGLVSVSVSKVSGLETSNIAKKWFIKISTLHLFFVCCICR